MRATPGPASVALRQGIAPMGVWAVACALFLLAACQETTPTSTLHCTPADSAGMQLCGGAPIAAPRVAVVYWAADTIYRGTPAPGTFGSALRDTSLVGFFLRQLGASAWWRIDSAYGVGPLTYEAYWSNAVNVPVGSLTGSFVSEDQIVAMLQSGIAGGKVPTGPNVLFVVFTPPNVASVSDFPVTRCADHNGRNGLVFVVIPYLWQTYCEQVSGVAPFTSDNLAVDAMLGYLAHELAEAASDPIPLTGWTWAGVYDRENADRCLADFTGYWINPEGRLVTVTLGGRDFKLQTNWRNTGAGGCALGVP